MTRRILYLKAESAATNRIKELLLFERNGERHTHNQVTRTGPSHLVLYRKSQHWARFETQELHLEPMLVCDVKRQSGNQEPHPGAS